MVAMCENHVQHNALHGDDSANGIIREVRMKALVAGAALEPIITGVNFRNLLSRHNEDPGADHVR